MTLLRPCPILLLLAVVPAFCTYTRAEEPPDSMRRLLDRLPPGDQAFIGKAKYCGKFPLAQIVTYSSENARLRAEFHLPDVLKKELPGTDPVLISIEGSPHVWTLHRRKSGTLDEHLSLITLTCFAPEIAWPFNRFSLSSDGHSLMVAGAQMFGTIGFQPYLTMNQGENSLHLAWRIEEEKYKPQRIDLLDATQLPTRAQAVFDKYLLPILRRLGPARPASDVYRVFDQLPADAEMTRKVLPLVQKLDSPEAGDRDAALKALVSLGRPAILATLRIDRATLTPEQVARLASFYAADGWLHVPDIDAARTDEAFLSDCLEDEDKAVQTAAATTLAAIRAVRQ